MLPWVVGGIGAYMIIKHANVVSTGMNLALLISMCSGLGLCRAPNEQKVWHS